MVAAFSLGLSACVLDRTGQSASEIYRRELALTGARVANLESQYDKVEARVAQLEELSRARGQEEILKMETLDQEDYLRRTGKLSRPMSELRNLSIDLRSAVQTLPPELRELCKRLQTESVTEISRDTGIPRGTIYESIKKLRAIFEDAGLKDYL
jgi:TolA-binding protein